MINKTELQLLQQALEKLEQGYSHLPEFAPAFDAGEAADVLQELLEAVEHPVVRRVIRMRLAELYRDMDRPEAARQQLEALILQR